MSTARNRKITTPESVPGEGDPDRKRVLNVLAQRRYRQRRKDKIAALEAHASATPHSRSEEKEIVRKDKLPPSAPDPLETVTADVITDESTMTEVVSRSYSVNYTSLSDFVHDPFDLTLPQEHTFANLPTPLPSTPLPLSPAFSPTPDASLLRIPILDTLHAIGNISVAFNVAEQVWDPSYLHIVSSCLPAVAALPPNLHPVTAQLTIPHHPMLDLLPWPSVREKLICMFSMPSILRPPVAREDDADDGCSIANHTSHCSGGFGVNNKQSKAIMRLMYDLEGVHGGEGLRVHGNMTAWGEGNELVEDAWEIGDDFYRKWWWCLDQRIVEVANRRRRERGLGRLKMDV